MGGAAIPPEAGRGFAEVGGERPDCLLAFANRRCARPHLEPSRGPLRRRDNQGRRGINRRAHSALHVWAIDESWMQTYRIGSTPGLVRSVECGKRSATRVVSSSRAASAAGYARARSLAVAA